MKLYAIRDTKANALHSFNVIPSDAEASRQFQDAVNQPNSVYGRYAEDFELVSVAQVFPESQEPVQPFVGIHVVLTAAQVVALRPGAPDPAQLSLIGGDR